MAAGFARETYDNISQRTVSSYFRGLAAFPSAAEDDEAAARRDLHGFFRALYMKMYEDPVLFGLPVTPDDRLESAAEHGERKQEVTQKLKKPREVVCIALELLRDLGCRGRLREADLVLGADAFKELCKAKAKVKKAVMAGCPRPV